MKKKKLEIMLQKVPTFKEASTHLEQYITPAGIAAEILYLAYQYGDIENKIVVDLGCGTGIFSIGAAIIGAKKVIGIDIDKKSIKIAKEYSKKINQKINFEIKNIGAVKVNCDTVIMNPPFGAQKSNINADRKFLEKAFEISSVIYSLHLTKTLPFIEKMIKSMGGKIYFSKIYNFPIKQTYNFHEKKVAKYNVSLLRILK